jgi:hypothetical protein
VYIYRGWLEIHVLGSSAKMKGKHTTVTVYLQTVLKLRINTLTVKVFRNYFKNK